MRLMSWNIYNGFSNWQGALIDGAKDIIAQYDPDVLVLNEALHCEVYNGVKFAYRSLGSFPYSFGSLYANEWGNIILSKKPILNTKSLSFQNRGALLGNIDGVCIATYHPHPHSKNKEYDFTIIAEFGNPDILCGDFNLIDPRISETYNHASMIEGFKRFSEKPKEDYERFVNDGHTVFEVLKQNGYYNVTKGDDYTIPTDFCSLDKSSAIRLDYIMARKHVGARTGNGNSPKLRVKDSFVIKDAEHISDHRPLIADFEIIHNIG